MKKIFLPNTATKRQRRRAFFFAPPCLRDTFIRASAALILAIIGLSCKKDNSNSGIPSLQQRTIRFQLYTNQDFSTNTSVINFKVFIQNGSRTLFDSSLASMQIKDIPDNAHKIVIEKTVADNSDLAAGFRYEIQNVGMSWHIDTSKSGNNFKVIDYAFQ